MGWDADCFPLQDKIPCGSLTDLKLIMWPRLASSSWQFFCLSFLSARTMDLSHHVHYDMECYAVLHSIKTLPGRMVDFGRIVTVFAKWGKNQQ